MKHSLTHRPSSQGWAPGVLPFFVQVFCLSRVCTWMEGWGEEIGYLLLCFFSIIYILGLVCYKHTIHIYYIYCTYVIVSVDSISRDERDVPLMQYITNA